MNNQQPFTDAQRVAAPAAVTKRERNAHSTNPKKNPAVRRRRNRVYESAYIRIDSYSVITSKYDPTIEDEKKGRRQ